MTTTPPQHHPPATPPGRAGQHLAAIAASLAGRGVTARLDILGGTPVLTIEDAAAGPDPAAVAIDPAPGPGHHPAGLQLECTCTWTPAPGATPEATAVTVLAVLDAIRPSRHQPPASPFPGPAARPSTRRTGHPPAAAIPPRRDELTPRIFRALYGDYELRTVEGTTFVAVPRGTAWHAGHSIGEIARQISSRNHQDPAAATPPGVPLPQRQVAASLTEQAGERTS
jgi:hypothetical protein